MNELSLIDELDETENQFILFVKVFLIILGSPKKKLYIKANMVVSVCVDKNWAVPGRFFQSLPVPCLWLQTGQRRAGQGRGKAGQGGQGSRCRGPGEVPFLLKKSLGKIDRPASNQTKIQFKKYIFSL